MNLQNKQIHRLRDRTYDCCGEDGWKGIVWEFGIDMYTLVYLKWITSKDLLLMELWSVLCGSLEGRAVWGRMLHVYVWLSPLLCSFETITALLISYTPVQNKKF